MSEFEDNDTYAYADEYSPTVVLVMHGRCDKLYPNQARDYAREILKLADEVDNR